MCGAKVGSECGGVCKYCGCDGECGGVGECGSSGGDAKVVLRGCVIQIGDVEWSGDAKVVMVCVW